MACCLHFTGIPLRPGSGSGSDNADRFASISSPGVDNGELSCSCQDDMVLAASSTRYQWRTGWSFRVKRSKAASPSESPRTKLLTSTCADPRLPFLHHHSTITSDIVSHKICPVRRSPQRVERSHTQGLSCVFIGSSCHVF
jgi:hypothetical protein